MAGEGPDLSVELLTAVSHLLTELLHLLLCLLVDVECKLGPPLHGLSTERVFDRTGLESNASNAVPSSRSQRFRY